MSEAEDMLRTIEREVRITSDLLGKDVLDARVLEALRRVPRERFVPPEERPLAYANTAVSIDCGQTISQPYIVAVMSDALALTPDERVLEVGTGSGYQTAVLARLVREVFTIELVRPLSLSARVRLAALDLENVAYRVGDGREGWPEHAPFDKIIVTAASRDIPVALCAQLRPGGRMILPVETSPGRQWLTLLTKIEEDVQTRAFLPVAFVPLRRVGPEALSGGDLSLRCSRYDK